MTKLHYLLASLIAAILLAVTAAAPQCREQPLNTKTPKLYRKSVRAPLNWLRYDGVSPFLKRSGAEVGKSNNMNLYLQGRGRGRNPLIGDAFGAGERLSTAYAYKGGTVCAWMRYPDPRSGTIVGMYLIDVHPKGNTRWSTKWREVDYEWLGLHPDEVATSLFEQGRNQPNAIRHKLAQITGAPGASVRTPIKYCITWDLLSANNKYVKWTAQAAGRPMTTVREWRPSTPEVNKFWDAPLRAVFTFWSNSHIAEWSGPYSLAENEVLTAEFKDVSFQPKGPAFCVKNDEDLEPSLWT